MMIAKAMVINNAMKHIIYPFVDFITGGKLVGGCTTDQSTATFAAEVSTNVWRFACIVASYLL